MVISQNVHGAKGFHGSLDNLVAKLDRVIVGDCFSTSLLDLVDDEICGPVV